MQASINVFGEKLEDCSQNPVTGFFRDGCCNTSRQDGASHTVCALLTEDFLSYSKQQGNDLSSPRPEFGFPGLKAGDQWCLCASRWNEAFEAGCAPRVRLSATHKAALEIVDFDNLKRHAADLN